VYTLMREIELKPSRRLGLLLLGMTALALSALLLADLPRSPRPGWGSPRSVLAHGAGGRACRRRLCVLRRTAACNAWMRDLSGRMWKCWTTVLCRSHWLC